MCVRDACAVQDPMDVGGFAELKWIAEYADIHGIQMAPHGMSPGTQRQDISSYKTTRVVC